MRKIDFDSFPHIVSCLWRIGTKKWFSARSMLLSRWWGISLGQGCSFNGIPRFRRHPRSSISVGEGCTFNSSPASNLIGVNRPCIISTLSEGANVKIGTNCGFSGTVIGAAENITIGDNVMCGANTLITDTDWHSDDPRASPNAPVKIEDGVWLGVNVTVLKGVTIGENAMVAAGSVVTRSLPAGSVAAGVPAIIVKEGNQPDEL